MKSISITHGMAEGTLAGLSDADKARILKLMSRAAEKAYRRGFQQGVVISATRPQTLPRSLYDWRYGASLDVSPWADSPNREKSLQRLFAECRDLRRLGLIP